MVSRAVNFNNQELQDLRCRLPFVVVVVVVVVVVALSYLTL